MKVGAKGLYWFLWLVLVFILWFGRETVALACSLCPEAEQTNDPDTIVSFVEQWLSEEDVEGVQEELEKEMGGNHNFHFYSYVMDLMTGKEPFTFWNVVHKMTVCLQNSILEQKSIWSGCFFIALCSIFFANVASIFQNQFVGKVGAYAGMLWMATLFLSVFRQVFQGASQLLSSILLFMKALFPVFFMTVSASGGLEMANQGYGNVLCVITAVEYFVGTILFRMISVYFYLAMLNHFMEKDTFSKALEWLEEVVKWATKGLFGLVIGMNSLQSLLLPAMEKVKRLALLRSGEAIPVVGDALSGTTELTFGIMSLLRNAVGVAGVIGLFVVCGVPLLKLLVYAFIFRGEAALLQPLGGEKICQSFVYVSKTAQMLLEVELTCVLLFAITLIMLAFSLGGL